ncbi:MAG: hypothetical protein WCG66_05540 [bacterium]
MKRILQTVVMLPTLIISSHHSFAATPTSHIKEVASDCENLEGEQILWKGEGNDSTAVIEPGVGFNRSKGLHFKASKAGFLNINPLATIGHPPLDVSLADGYMFWVKVVDAVTFSLEFKSQEFGGHRFVLGEGVLAMDTTGNFLDLKEYLLLPRDKANPAAIKLPADFEGWIIIPSTVSTEGLETGWKCSNPDATGQHVPPIKGLLFVTGPSGEFYLDHFSLYQAKH